MQLGITSTAEMEALGAGFAPHLTGDSLFYLQGELGSGKTTFVRGLLRGLGYGGHVKSPTYTLVEPYVTGGYQVYHFDLYRIAGPDELDDMGYRDYFDGHGVCLLEWPERAAGKLPAPDLYFTLSLTAGGRDVHCRAHTDTGEGQIRRFTEEADVMNQ